MFPQVERSCEESDRMGVSGFLFLFAIGFIGLPRQFASCIAV